MGLLGKYDRVDSDEAEFLYWSQMHRTYRAIRRRLDGAEPIEILAAFRKQVVRLGLAVPEAAEVGS